MSMTDYTVILRYVPLLLLVLQGAAPKALSVGVNASVCARAVSLLASWFGCLGVSDKELFALSRRKQYRRVTVPTQKDFSLGYWDFARCVSVGAMVYSLWVRYCNGLEKGAISLSCRTRYRILRE